MNDWILAILIVMALLLVSIWRYVLVIHEHLHDMLDDQEERLTFKE